MTIIIGLILAILIFFLYKKITANNADNTAVGSDSGAQSVLSDAAASAASAAEETVSGAADSVASAASAGANAVADAADSAAAATAAGVGAVTDGAASAASAGADALSSAASGVGAAAAAAGATAVAAAAGSAADSAANASSTPPVALHNAPPLEHLFGIDRRTGKALRSLGITDMNGLLNASADKLEAVGLDGAAAKVLQAQAALSTLPGVTPQEASLLANSGVDSVAALAAQDPSDLLSKVTRANRSVGALKTAPGVQQLQRLISSAKSAA